MGEIHQKMEDFKKWVDIDITDKPTHKVVTSLINSDLQKDSPTILNEIDGKYSPYKDKLSYLGRTHIDFVSTEKKLRTTLTVVRAVNIFKKNLKKNKEIVN